MRVLALIVVVLLAGWASPTSGQSLASVARKEEARRKEVKQPSRVITNKDLRLATNPPPPPPPTPDAAPAPDAATPAAAEGKAAADSPLTEEEQRKQDEQNWRKKMADARLALERSQMYADALQSKINALWADFTARDDPVQRAAASSWSASARSPSRTASKARSRPRRRRSSISRKRRAAPASRPAGFADARTRHARLVTRNWSIIPPTKCHSCWSRTRTHCARCCARRSKIRATSSSRPGTRPRRWRGCTTPDPTSCCRTCG